MPQRTPMAHPVGGHPTQRSSNGGLSYIGCYDSISSDTYQETFAIRAQSLLTRRFVFETCCNWLGLLLLLEMELLSTTFSLSSGRTCIRKTISVPTPSILLSWAAWLGFIHQEKKLHGPVCAVFAVYTLEGGRAGPTPHRRFPKSLPIHT